MGKDVIFDYSKAAAFIHEEEIAGIKAGCAGGKRDAGRKDRCGQ